MKDKITSLPNLTAYWPLNEQTGGGRRSLVQRPPRCWFCGAEMAWDNLRRRTRRHTCPLLQPATDTTVVVQDDDGEG